MDVSRLDQQPSCVFTVLLWKKIEFYFLCRLFIYLVSTFCFELQVVLTVWVNWTFVILKNQKAFVGFIFTGKFVTCWGIYFVISKSEEFACYDKECPDHVVSDSITFRCCLPISHWIFIIILISAVYFKLLILEVWISWTYYFTAIKRSGIQQHYEHEANKNSWMVTDSHFDFKNSLKYT